MYAFCGCACVGLYIGGVQSQNFSFKTLPEMVRSIVPILEADANLHFNRYNANGIWRKLSHTSGWKPVQK